MIKNIKKIFIILFPFLSVIFLWRMSATFWNPAGVLAIIPIFYYSFINPKNWMPIFSGIMCFLIDYNFGSMFFWTSMYCAFYCINGFQNYIDLSRQKFDGLFVFIGFISVSLFILTIIGFGFTGLLRGIWIILWASALYAPFTFFAKRITK